MNERIVMPIMQGVLLKAIPWTLISQHERQAQHNHDQTLNRLAERGGLCPSEALVIIQDKDWFAERPHDEQECERVLMRLIAA